MVTHMSFRTAPERWRFEPIASGGVAQLLAERGIRANAVAPGPIWTPLIPSTMPEEAVENFGKNVPMKRPGQPAACDRLRDAC
jgi:NAD(P)-dependent dehydrogenase (short-subunit alcohol dehydrogenase family)